MSKVSITRSLLDDLAMSISAKSGEAVPMTLTEMKDAVDSIQTGGSPTLQTITKTYTPTTSQQTESVSADSGYDGIDTVSITVNAMPTGTAGTPTATKGTVSNHSVSVTPSVTNGAGYIEGGTKTGTAVTVSASELVSGDLAITQNGNSIDCANYSTVSVSVPSSGSSWTHIAHTTLTVNTTSTSAASAGTLSCGTVIVDKSKIIYVRIRDQEGARAGYFAGSDTYFMNYKKANGSTSAFAVPAVLCHRYTTSSQWAGTAGTYGVYGYSISNTGVLTIRQRYNSNYSLTINSTYDVDVFTLDYPTGYPAVFDS